MVLKAPHRALMLSTLKHIIREHAPAPARHGLARAYGAMKIHRARRAFAAAAARPRSDWLAPAELDALIRRGFRPPPQIRYDPEGLAVRANEKVAHMGALVQLQRVNTAVELGSWDGMVGAALARLGIRVVGVDIVMTGIDCRAVDAGVRFVRSDAAATGLADESVDFVCSFGSLEHFPRPDRVLAEIARILRPGGHAYLDFGPLYSSPYGRHAYRQIPVPFCHLLFAEETLHAWADATRQPHDWPYVNGWTLAQYRNLWRSASAQFAVVTLTEHSTGGVGTELIAEYPTVFRHWSTNFDEFLISAVEIVLCKR